MYMDRKGAQSTKRDPPVSGPSYSIGLKSLKESFSEVMVL